MFKNMGIDTKIMFGLYVDLFTSAVLYSSTSGTDIDMRPKKNKVPNNGFNMCYDVTILTIAWKYTLFQILLCIV